jgi:hypothetical protein
VDERRRIWPQTPLEPALDRDALARQIEMSGGSIRNIALASVLLVAPDGGVIGLRHIKHAAQRESGRSAKR